MFIVELPISSPNHIIYGPKSLIIMSVANVMIRQKQNYRYANTIKLIVSLYYYNGNDQFALQFLQYQLSCGSIGDVLTQ